MIWENQKWFRKAKLGLFVHWGLYSVPGRGSAFSFWLPLVVTTAAETPRGRQTVFMRPEHDAAREEEPVIPEVREEDISDLLAYCEQKLTGEPAAAPRKKADEQTGNGGKHI